MFLSDGANQADAIIVGLVTIGFGGVIGLMAWIVRELIALGKNTTAQTQVLENVVDNVASLMEWRDSLNHATLEELIERRKYDWTATHNHPVIPPE